MFKNPLSKSPHPSRHLINMAGIFFAAVLLTNASGIGVDAGPSSALNVLSAGLTSAIALLGGTFITQQTRSLFNLMQTGRLFQYFSFWICSILGLLASSVAFPSVLLVENFALAAFAIVVVAFSTAIFVGEVPTKGRSWLPMRMR